MRERAASFAGVADAYARFRPTYPDNAVSWLVGTSPGRVLELGAGTGKLTAAISGLGHDVIATDPLAEMLRHVKKAAPAAHRVVGRAEHIALPSSSVDVVVAGQSFHWFDRDRALMEIARVLRPGGALALAWNEGDFKVPWVKKLFTLVGMSPSDDDDPVEGSDLFATSDRKVFRHWQQFHRDSLIGFVSSQSYTALLGASERETLLAEVGELYDSYGRGPDGMLMPWIMRCYRARVSGLAAMRPDEQNPDDGLLIDFD